MQNWRKNWVWMKREAKSMKYFFSIFKFQLYFHWTESLGKKIQPELPHGKKIHAHTSFNTITQIVCSSWFSLLRYSMVKRVCYLVFGVCFFFKLVKFRWLAGFQNSDFLSKNIIHLYWALISVCTQTFLFYINSN